MMNDDATESPQPDPSLSSGYPVFQLARALVAAEQADLTARERAAERVRQWTSVILGSISGAIVVGSRTPVKGVPGWATLEVAKGGFSTGALLAGGPLKNHERELLQEIATREPESEADARKTLNRYFLTDDGLQRLTVLLESGRFGVEVPEEGALLVVAWLLKSGRAQSARELVEELAPYFSRVRFYPAPLEAARQYDSRVCVEDVATTTHRLRAIKSNQKILAQQEAIQVWTPLYDQMVSLFLETITGDWPIALKRADGAWQRTEDGQFMITGGWPCAKYPDDWRAKVLDLLDRYQRLRAEHKHCARPERNKESFAQLVDYLRRCSEAPDSLSGREVGRIRLILARYVARRGPPGSPTCEGLRLRQSRHATAPTFAQIARQVIRRLEGYRPDDGLDAIAPIIREIDASEVESGIPVGTPVPAYLQRKIERCLKGTLATLVEQRTITSGETLAQVLPQLTSELHATAVADPVLRLLYAAIYRAFRRRRSLLLLDLQKQVQVEELPWIAAIDRLRVGDRCAKEISRQTLKDVSRLTITAFPHAILPNKLLRELRSLVNTAELSLPLVEEVAVDIFMGKFSPKFLVAAKEAASLLRGSLYAKYYGIDCQALLSIPVESEEKGSSSRSGADFFAQLCALRAGVDLGGGDVVKNGMIVEQQQILTTHNLAALFNELDLQGDFKGRLPSLAKRCFAWICRRLQMPAMKWHAKLIQVKNSAYAWRQMIFFLSSCSVDEVNEFMAWADAHLKNQHLEFQQRFEPALLGLASVASGSTDYLGSEGAKARQFLGWSKDQHWLLKDV